MTTENQSRIKQWARGVFYNDDGRKQTLVPKRLMVGAGIVFALFGGYLLVKDEPNSTLNESSHGTIAPPPSEISIPPSSEVPTPQPQGDGTRPPGTFVLGQNGEATGEERARKPRSRFRGPQLITRPRTVKIPPGAIVKARLVTGASDGPVRAETTETLSFAGETLIPQGTILLGMGQSGQDRLMIRFSQAIYADGAIETITAQGCDATDQIAGLKGSQIGDQAAKLGLGIGLNFVGGMSTALQDTQGEGGVVIARPTLKNALLNGAATAALDQSREVMADLRGRPPVYEIPALTPILIIFQKD